MALDTETARLYVASHRSGQTEQFPYPDTDVADEKDIAVIDVNRMENTDTCWKLLPPLITSFSIQNRENFG